MKTQILFNKEAKEKLLRGVNLMADTVSTTLGPRGQNVALTKFNYKGEIFARDVIHDGVSVAKAIDLPDEYENMGAQILKEAAQKQVDSCGDGTTAVMVLAQAIITECMQMVSTGINPMSLRKGLETGVEKLADRLIELATPIKTFEEMKYIATISAEDPTIGELVAGVFDKVGVDGVVTDEETQASETTVEHQTGMQFDKGWLHQLFVNNPEHMEATIEDAYLLITDKPITSLIQFGTFFKEFVEEKHLKNLVVISPDISGEALPLFIKNKMEMALNVLCVKAPSFGPNQKEMLHDIAIVTGGKFITEDAGHKFEDLTTADLGRAEYVTATRTDTIIIGGKGKKAAIDSRIGALKKQIEDETEDFDSAKLKERLAKLTSGVAVIKVGGQTEIEMKERRERVKDAIAATRAAMQQGIVPGGEIIYHEIRKVLDQNIIAERVLFNALSKPFEKLIDNAGINLATAAIALHGKSYTYGVDVTDEKVKDFLKVGIIDPVAVPLNALRNAVSVAVQLATTGAIIVPEVKDEK